MAHSATGGEVIYSLGGDEDMDSYLYRGHLCKWASNETWLEFKFGLGSSGGIMDNWSEEEINAPIHIHLFRHTYVEKGKMRNFTCNFEWFLPQWEISHLQFGSEDSTGSFVNMMEICKYCIHCAKH